MIAFRFTALVVLVLSLSGCRLYGGRGSTEIVREDINSALATFQTTYDHAARDLAKIKNEPSNASVAAFYEQYRSAVMDQKEQLDQSSESAADALESGGYRKVSRVVGSLVSAQATSRDRYRSILLAAGRSAGIATTASTLRDLPPTQAVPAYYQRSAADVVPGVDEILAALRR
jgi:hypothetical protein